VLSFAFLVPACESFSNGEPSGFCDPPLLAPAVLPTVTPTSTASPNFVPTATATPTCSPTALPTATLPPLSGPVIAATEIVRGNPERPWIALTFDSSDSRSATASSILDTLRDKNVRCTMFLTTGAWVKKNADLVRRMVAEGHELANHSYSHPHFPQLSDEEMGRELAALEETVMQVAGRSTKPYFRPPYGDRDDRVLQVVQENGYLSVYWTYHVRDWFPDETPESVFRYALNGACNGAIVVMHLGSWQTAQALPDIIDALEARGYRLVTLSELLAP
jgi:peptidoglycan/xylan/chitin deacetylase (PgdA/CDA1 family)